jgi:hypothetical protein
MQQRQTGEQAGVDPVRLGVLGVVGAQVCRALGWDEHDPRASTTETRRQRDPGVARRFHDHHEVPWIGAFGELRP